MFFRAKVSRWLRGKLFVASIDIGDMYLETTKSVCTYTGRETLRFLAWV